MRHPRKAAWRLVVAIAASVALAACTSPPPDVAQPEQTTAPAPPSPSGTPAGTERPPETQPRTEPPAEPTPTPSPRVRLRQTARVALREFATLDSPIAMADRNGDRGVYIAERGGVVRRLSGSGAETNVVLDISAQTSVSSERGLLGIEFSADGTTLFASYTDVNGNSHVDAYAMQGRSADTSSRRELLFVEQPAGNHNGGNVARGPDGRIYLGLGDGGGAGDPLEAAQDPSSALGKMLRLGQNPQQVALGLRNPWRFSFDRDTGDVWIGDVGQGSREEIDYLPFRRLDGANFGWDNLEGTVPFEGGGEPQGYVAPIHDYGRDDGRCSITGGYVYRGSAIPSLFGRYVYGDYCDGQLRTLTLRGSEVVTRRLGLGVGSLVSFGEDADGELYALSLDGPVYRLVRD